MFKGKLKLFSYIVVLFVIISLMLSSCSVNTTYFKENGENMNAADFDKFLMTLPYFAAPSESRDLDSSELKVTLTGNMNNVKKVVVAFSAWDAGNMPVKIKSVDDNTNGAYARQISFYDIDVSDDGDTVECIYEVDPECHIDSFKVIVLSVETNTGEEWNNPYYGAWYKLYVDTKMSDDMSVFVDFE